MEKDPTLDPQKLETLRMLYPLFKQEVFDRRDRIMRITSLAGGFLLLILGLILYLIATSKPLLSAPWIFSIGVIIFTGLTLYQIKQHSRRHAQAKLGLIEIEKALGLFEPGTYLPDRGLYPQDWQTRFPRDYSLVFYASCLIALAMLVIVSLLMVI